MIDAETKSDDYAVKRRVLGHATKRLRHGCQTDAIWQAEARTVLNKHGLQRFKDAQPDQLDGLIFDARLTLALLLAKMWPIFPLRTYRKDPFRSTHAHLEATQDPFIIADWIGRYPDCNWGAVGAFLDVDTKNNGMENFATLCAEHSEPNTAKIVTPTQGFHFPLDEPDLHGVKCDIASGVELPNYVVAVGSFVVKNPEANVRETGFYTWATQKPIGKCQWIVDLAKKREKAATPSIGDNGAPACEPDTDAAIAAATDYLKRTVEAGMVRKSNGTQTRGVSVQGQEGDNYVVKVINQVGDFGVSREACFELMRDHFNPHCVPEWPLEGSQSLRTKVDSAYNSRRTPIGSKSAVAEFGEADDDDLAAATTVPAQPKAAESPFGPNQQKSIEIECLDDVEAAAIEFIWADRLAKGKHSLLAGPGGFGKSQVVYDSAARITKGAEWPCGTGTAPKGSVVLLNAEDGVKDMMKPRCVAAGANTKLISRVKAVRDHNGRTRKFNLMADLDQLYAACRERGDVVMVGIDPLGSYLGGELDTHRDAALRDALDPISQFAETAEVGVFSVAHFNKAGQMRAAVDRVMGSAAFVNAPRCAMAFMEHPQDNTKRLFVGLKSNIGDKPGGLIARLEKVHTGLIDARTGREIEATHIVYEGTSDLSADAAIAAANERVSPKLDEAVAFLNTMLKDGPVPVEAVKKQATALGISAITLKRAKAEAGVSHRQIPGAAHGGWEYFLDLGGIDDD